MAALTQSRAFVISRIAIRSGRLSAQRTFASSTTRMAFTLPDLPYPIDALEKKGMSQKTLEFHWGKHHAAYVNNYNGQVKDKADLTLEQAVLKAWNGGKPTPEFNNAAQIWNHTFFWESMSPNGGGTPKGKVAEAINRDFGSYEAFKDQFKAAAATQFGSGWAWLVKDGAGKLSVTKTPNAENPVVHGQTPILTIDVWEHAYYLDVQNRRPDFITNFIDNLIDWDRVESRYNA